MFTKDFINSLIRTYTPMLVPFLVVIGVDADVATLFIGQVAYYFLARAAEQVNPKAGWILGKAKAPAYTIAAPDGD